MGDPPSRKKMLCELLKIARRMICVVSIEAGPIEHFLPGLRNFLTLETKEANDRNVIEFQALGLSNPKHWVRHGAGVRVKGLDFPQGLLHECPDGAGSMVRGDNGQLAVSDKDLSTQVMVHADGEEC